MYGYTIEQWFFLFCFYSLFGWCYESAYVSIKQKRWVNRGFMTGPFLPLYGSGAVMLLFVAAPFREHVWAVFLAGVVGATILEYLTGTVMEALFKVRYWDYSNMPFNYKGRISLFASLLWGVMAVFINYFLQVYVEKLVFFIPEKTLSVIDCVLLIGMVADFSLAFKEALNFKMALSKLSGIKENLQRIKQKLSSLTPIKGDELEQKRDFLWDGLTRHSAEIKNEIINLYSDYKENQAKKEHLKKEKWLYRILRNNPTMHSEKYKEILQELREHIKR